MFFSSEYQNRLDLKLLFFSGKAKENEFATVFPIFEINRPTG